MGRVPSNLFFLNSATKQLFIWTCSIISMGKVPPAFWESSALLQKVSWRSNWALSAVPPWFHFGLSLVMPPKKHNGTTLLWLSCCKEWMNVTQSVSLPIELPPKFGSCSWNFSVSCFTLHMLVEDINRIKFFKVVEKKVRKDCRCCTLSTPLLPHPWSKLSTHSHLRPSLPTFPCGRVVVERQGGRRLENQYRANPSLLWLA